jgi:putative ABC transport system permease protein
MGASVTGVTTLVSKEFVVLVLVASVVAAPLAYLGMSSWLESFAF